jgi:hypothetical protein
MLRNCLLLSLVLILISCATDVANRYYANQHYPEKPVNEVELLYQQPARPFTVIADFQSRNESPSSVRQKAAKIGADAVIVSTLGGLYFQGEQWAGNDTFSNTYSRIIGTAIKYTP